MRKEVMESTSAAYDVMSTYWTKVAAVRGGLETMQLAARSLKFLPQLPRESDELYRWRVENCKFTDLFTDIVSGLASKPFEKETSVDKEMRGGKYAKTAEDIDRAGTHISVFAGEFFLSSLMNALEYILVDYPSVPEGATLAQVGDARPYWVRISADNALMVKTAVVDGNTQFVYFKIKETALVTNKDGATVETAQVRIFIRDYDEATGTYLPARFEVWQQDPDELTDDYHLVDSGQIRIDVIPIVALVIGERLNDQMLVRPPYQNLLDKQIQYFQSENNYDNLKTQTAFPMYVAVGVNAPEGDKGEAVGTVGCNTIVYLGAVDEGGQQADFKILEPAGTSLDHLAKDLDKQETQMRELGKMPLIGGTSGITQVAAAAASKKASSQAQMWTFKLKDSLESAMKLTAAWIGLPGDEPQVDVFTDFAVELSDEKAPQLILDAFKEGIFSRQTVRDEYQRRGIVSPDYDAEADDEAILNEGFDAENERLTQNDEFSPGGSPILGAA